MRDESSLKIVPSGNFQLDLLKDTTVTVSRTLHK